MALSDPHSTRWRPILEAIDQRRVDKALQSIITGLSRERFAQLRGPDLATGLAGVALFLHSIQHVRADDVAARRASTYLTMATAAVKDLQWPALFHGSAGIGWVAGELDQHTHARLLAEIDMKLLAGVMRPRWRGSYDLSTGLVGFGLYALARRPRPLPELLLNAIVDRLEELAVRTTQGAAWRTAPSQMHADTRELYPNGFFNLGVAHGNPGVIALLGQLFAANVASGKTRALLDEAVCWLLAHENPNGARSSFTRLVADNKPQPEGWETLAWCHGDIGVSAALYGAAVSVREAHWAEVALRIARKAATRAVDDAGVVDAGLCHGAAGNGHIFNRFYQATQDPIFLDAARRWLRHALDFHQPESSAAGFRTWVGYAADGTDLWQDRPGLLDGATGVGLALLAATTDIEPLWDRLLLVSLRSASDQD